MSGIKGNASGATEKELVDNARKSAATFFGTPCVVVKLSEAQLIDGIVTADFTGAVWHNIEHATYGPGKCRGCSRENWPQSPLNETKEWS